MFKKRSTFSVSIPVIAALGAALFSSGCLETEKGQANSKCQATYIGRQRSACEMGVDYAAKEAVKDESKSAKAKYLFALKRCQGLEQPLVPACKSGVNGLVDVLAASHSSSYGDLASAKSNAGNHVAKGRSIASTGSN